MKLRLHISPEEDEKYITIHAPEFDDEVQQVITNIEDLNSLKQLYGKQDDMIHIIEIQTITSFVHIKIKSLQLETANNLN